MPEGQLSAGARCGSGNVSWLAMPSAAGETNGVGVRPRVCTWYIRHVDVFRRMSARDVDELAVALSVRRFTAGHLIVGP